jgi:hypothetical protein
LKTTSSEPTTHVEMQKIKIPKKLMILQTFTRLFFFTFLMLECKSIFFVLVIPVRNRIYIKKEKKIQFPIQLQSFSSFDFPLFDGISVKMKSKKREMDSERQKSQIYLTKFSREEILIKISSVLFSIKKNISQQIVESFRL